MGSVRFWVGFMILGSQNIAWGMGPKAPPSVMTEKGASLVCENPYERPTLAELKLDIVQVSKASRYDLTGSVRFPDGSQQQISTSANGNVALREIRLEIPGTGTIELKLEMLKQGGPTLIGAVSLYGKTEELFLCHLGPKLQDAI